MSRRGRSGANPDIQGQRSIGRSGGQVRRRGGIRRVVHARAGGGEREREIYSYGEIDRRLRGKERVLSTRPPLYGRRMRIHRALDRARASPGHRHLSIYRNADPPRVLGRVTGHDGRGRDNQGMMPTPKPPSLSSDRCREGRGRSPGQGHRICRGFFVVHGFFIWVTASLWFTSSFMGYGFPFFLLSCYLLPSSAMV